MLGERLKWGLVSQTVARVGEGLIVNHPSADGGPPRNMPTWRQHASSKR